MEEKKYEVIEAVPNYEETVELQLYVVRSNIRVFVLFGVAFLAIGLLIGIISPSWVAYVAAAFGVFFVIMGIMLRFSAIGVAKKSFEQSKDLKQLWHIYEDHIELYSYRGEKQEVFLSLDVDKIIDVAVLKRIYAFRFEKVAFGVSKTDLSPDSILFGILFPSGKAESRKKDVNTVSVLYRSVSMASLLFAIVSFYFVEKYPSLWWLGFVGIALSLASLIIFAVVRTDGKKLKGGVSGIIMAILASILSVMIILIGLTSFLNGGFDYITDDSFFVGPDDVGDTSVISVAGITLPDTDNYYFDEYKYYDKALGKYVDVANTTYYYYDSKDIDAICDSIEASDLWLPELDEEMQSCFGGYLVYVDGDMLLIYNATEGTYNSLPSTVAPCEYIALVFTSMYEYIDIYRFVK